MPHAPVLLPCRSWKSAGLVYQLSMYKRCYLFRYHCISSITIDPLNASPDVIWYSVFDPLWIMESRRNLLSQSTSWNHLMPNRWRLDGIYCLNPSLSFYNTRLSSTQRFFAVFTQFGNFRLKSFMIGLIFSSRLVLEITSLFAKCIKRRMSCYRFRVKYWPKMGVISNGSVLE